MNELILLTYIAAAMCDNNNKKRQIANQKKNLSRMRFFYKRMKDCVLYLCS